MHEESTLANMDDGDGSNDSEGYPLCENIIFTNLTALNATDELSSVELRTVNFVFGIVLTGLIVATGLIGNALSFFVLLKGMRKANTATPIILCALAVVDILFLISSFYLQFIGTLSDGPLKSYQAYIVALFSFIFGLGNVCRMCRNWLVILVSLERVIAVKNPLKATIIFTKANAAIGILVITTASILLCLPRFFEANINQCKTEDGSLYTGAVSSELREKSVYRFAYTIGFYFLMVTAGPCVILLVLNTLLIVQVRRAGMARAALSATDKKKKNGAIPSVNFPSRPMASRSDSPAGCRVGNEQNPNPVSSKISQYSAEITRICIAIVVVYLICEIPPLLYQTKLSLVGDDHNSEFLDYLQPIANFFATTNSGVNFYIYVFLGSRFRKNLVICKSCNMKVNINETVYRSQTLSISAMQRIYARGKRPVRASAKCVPQMPLALDNVLHKSFMSVTSDDSSVYLHSRDSSKRSANLSVRTTIFVDRDRAASIRTNFSAP